MSQEQSRKRRKVAPDPQAIFQCTFPGCGSSYRRKEHLNRHVQQHTQEPKHPCNYCSRKFFRRDILRRHLELHDEDIELTRSRISKACHICRSRKTRCDGNFPCRTCSEKELDCTYGEASQPAANPQEKSSTPPLATEFENSEDLPTPKALPQQSPPEESPNPPEALSLLDVSMLASNGFVFDPHAWANFPDLGDIRRHIDTYWRRFHPKWLLLHQQSFLPEREPPFLLLSMVMTSLWTSGDAESRTVALDLHQRLITMLYQQRDKWDFTPTTPTTPWPLATLQAILLHLILALTAALPLASPSPTTSTTTCPLQNTHALLTDLIRACHRLNTFSYSAMLAQFGGADLVIVTWVRVEEVKRFNLILFGLWNAFHASEWAVARGLVGDEELGWGDLRFQAPEPDELWTAVGVREFLARRERCGLSGRRHDEEGSWICNLVGGDGGGGGGGGGGGEEGGVGVWVLGAEHS